MTIKNITPMPGKVKARGEKLSKSKKNFQPTITVTTRVYRDDAERLAKLRMFAETLTPDKTRGGDLL